MATSFIGATLELPYDRTPYADLFAGSFYAYAVASYPIVYVRQHACGSINPTLSCSLKKLLFQLPPHETVQVIPSLNIHLALGFIKT